MEFRLGTRVLAADGQDAGAIDTLILDPNSGDVKAVILRRGTVFTNDIEIPRTELTVDESGKLRLACDAAHLDNLPRFDEGAYAPPPPGYVPPLYPGGYPTAGVLWPIAGWPAAYGPVPTTGARPSSADREMDAMIRRHDLESAVIDEGSDVISQDGEKVGEVHSISFDPQTGRPLEFVIRRGFLLKEDLPLHADAIASADDGVIRLKLDRHQIEAYFNRAA